MKNAMIAEMALTGLQEEEMTNTNGGIPLLLVPGTSIFWVGPQPARMYSLYPTHAPGNATNTNNPSQNKQRALAALRVQ